MQFPWAAERDSLQLYLCTARTELVRLSAVESIFHFLWVNTTTQRDRQTDVVSDSCSASASASVRCSASATAIAIDMVNSFWSDEKNENEKENENELNKRNEMRSH